MLDHDVAITAVFNDVEPGWTLDASLGCGIRKAQYRLFCTETTVSEESELEGWEQAGCTFGDWSNWSNTKQSIPDTEIKEQKIRTVYPYYCFVCSSCGAHMPYWSASSSYSCIKSLAYSNDIVLVSISGSTRTIGSRAFAGCRSLQSVTVPASVSSIASDAFIGCPSLTLFVYAGSAAESFAESNGIPYQIIQ